MYFKLRNDCLMRMNEDGIVVIETGVLGHTVEIDSEDFYMAFEKIDDSTALNRDLVQLMLDTKEVIRDNLHAVLYKNEKTLYEIFQRIEMMEQKVSGNE